MDSNETLKQAREAAKKLDEIGISAPGGYYALCDLLTSFIALDEWLTKGGFLPEDWKPKTASIHNDLP